jgi:hypothetical protein
MHHRLGKATDAVGEARRRRTAGGPNFHVARTLVRGRTARTKVRATWARKVHRTPDALDGHQTPNCLLGERAVESTHGLTCVAAARGAVARGRLRRQLDGPEDSGTPAQDQAQSMADEEPRSKFSVPRPLWIGLAALLVIVTGIALRVGIPIYRQRAAIQVVEALGGRVETRVKVPDWIKKRFGLSAAEKIDWLFSYVITVNLGYLDVVDSKLEFIRVFIDLESLYIHGTEVTDSGLGHLQGLTKLQRLSLKGTQVTDTGLNHLQGLTNLESLFLNGTQVTDAGLKHLQRLTKLEWLFLDGTRVTDAGLQHLLGLTNLEWLTLNGTQVTPGGVAKLKAAIPGVDVEGVPAQPPAE